MVLVTLVSDTVVCYVEVAVKEVIVLVVSVDVVCVVDVTVTEVSVLVVRVVDDAPAMLDCVVVVSVPVVIVLVEVAE